MIVIIRGPSGYYGMANINGPEASISQSIRDMSSCLIDKDGEEISLDKIEYLILNREFIIPADRKPINLDTRESVIFEAVGGIGNDDEKEEWKSIVTPDELLKKLIGEGAGWICAGDTSEVIFDKIYAVAILPVNPDIPTAYRLGWYENITGGIWHTEPDEDFLVRDYKGSTFVAYRELTEKEQTELREKNK